MSARPGLVKTRLFDVWFGTLGELARRTKLDVSTLSVVKSGKRDPGSRFVAHVLAAFPDFQFRDLFYWEPNTQQKNQPDETPVA